MCWVKAKGKENGGRKYKEVKQLQKNMQVRIPIIFKKNLRHNKISIYFLRHSIIMVSGIILILFLIYVDVELTFMGKILSNFIM